MANFEFNELAYLYGLAMKNPQIPIKIGQKYEGIKRINRSGRREYPAPQLKPPGAPAFHSQKMPQGQIKQELEQKVKAFEEQINKEIIETVYADFEEKYSDELRLLSQLSNEDLIDLLEEGSNKVLENQKQREPQNDSPQNKRLKTMTKEELDALLDDKIPTQSDQFNPDLHRFKQNKADIIQSIKMNELESKRFFNSLEPNINFDEKTKDLDKSNEHEPTKE